MKCVYVIEGRNVLESCILKNLYLLVWDFVFPEQAPGTELIDKAVIDGALNYIVRNQGRQGQLSIVGRVHNFGLLVGTYNTHTHFVCKCVVHYLLRYYTPVCANDESH